MAELKQLRLSTPVATRKSLARIIRAFHSSDIPETKFRALVYGFACLLNYWKLETDLQIEDRLTELEKILESRGEL